MFCQLKILIHFQNRSKDFKAMFFFMVVVMYLCCLVLTMQIMCVHMNSHVFSNGLQASLVTQMDNLQQSIELHEKNILNMPKAMEVSFVLSTTFSWTICFLPIAIFTIQLEQFIFMFKNIMLNLHMMPIQTYMHVKSFLITLGLPNDFDYQLRNMQYVWFLMNPINKQIFKIKLN